MQSLLRLSLEQQPFPLSKLRGALTESATLGSPRPILRTICAIWNIFVQRLRELGYSQGSNLMIEERYAEGRMERYAEFAAEMVKIKADIVFTSNPIAARAVMAVSRAMPIVTIFVPDPVRAGLIASYAHPGGQLTGISNVAQELVLKQLELLKTALPTVTRIAFAACPRFPQSLLLRADEVIQ